MRWADLVEHEKLAERLSGRPEWVISQGRLALSVVALTALLIDSGQVQEDRTAAVILLAGYAAWSLILVASSTYRTPFPETTLHVFHGVDVVVVSLLLTITEGAQSPYYLFYIFVLVAAAIRWSWPGPIATGALLIFLFGLVSGSETIFGSRAGAPEHFDYPLFALRSMYLLVASGLLAYFSFLRDQSQLRLRRIASWSGIEGAAEDHPKVETALAQAATAISAPRILLIWEELQEPVSHFALWDHGKMSEGQEAYTLPDGFLAHELRDATFACLDAGSDGYMLRSGWIQPSPRWIDPDFTARFFIKSAGSAPFTGTTCRGRLFALDRETWTNDHFALVEIVASRIGAELDRSILARRLNTMAAVSERFRLARDLHDGVLQTLAAAGFHLKLLAENPQWKAQADRLREMLSSEQRRIREFVQSTRASSPPRPTAAQPLRASLDELAAKWNCEIILDQGVDDLPKGTLTEILLIVSEAVSNAVRHGAATSCHVSVSVVGGNLGLVIQDNGRGLAAAPGRYDSAALETMRLGPASIRERTAALGGQLDLVNAATGVRLELTWPVK